jgi:hypothetical protein
VPNLQFGSRKPEIQPNCKFGTLDFLIFTRPPNQVIFLPILRMSKQWIPASAGMTGVIYHKN